MFDSEILENKFARIGARLKVSAVPSPGVGVFRDSSVRLDVQRDRAGEFFLIVAADGESGVEVLDTQPADRHLLLLVRERGEKRKFLCGHDERHWFIAAVPESAPAGTVLAAKEALKPPAVRAAQSRLGLRAEARNRRKNAAYRRQGEWFFVPAPDLKVDEKLVLRDEPIRRGGGKPHWADLCYRTGGTTVYVCRRYPNGVTLSEYRRLLDVEPGSSGWGWRPMVRDARVYVRGRIRHADHRTVTLHGWHRVLMNTENEAKAMRHVAFLD